MPHLQHISACLLICLGLSSCAEKTPPNILLIVADDMNEYGFLRTHPQVLTPSLDAFREEAITFPHSPYTCPQRFMDMYDPSEITIPEGYLEADLADLPPIPRTFIEMGDQKEFRQITSTKEQWKKYLRGYFACYTFADHNIGQVIQALDKSAYAENTIVIVTSDNGFHMGEKDRFNKNGLWEQSAITPMAVRVPGSSHAGETCPAPLNLQDLYPTFVDLCSDGLEPLEPVDGHSFSRLLENPDVQWESPSITYFGKGWRNMSPRKWPKRWKAAGPGPWTQLWTK